MHYTHYFIVRHSLDGHAPKVYFEITFVEKFCRPHRRLCGFTTQSRRGGGCLYSSVHPLGLLVTTFIKPPREIASFPNLFPTRCMILWHALIIIIRKKYIFLNHINYAIVVKKKQNENSFVS